MCHPSIFLDYFIVTLQKKVLFNVKWKRCADLPVATSVPRTAVTDSQVYVALGEGPTSPEAVFSYSFSEDSWKTLPHCPTYQHSLAVLKEQLHAVGGIVSSTGKQTNKIYTLNLEKWRSDLFPKMPTSRSHLCTVTHADSLLVAAGGTVSITASGERQETDAVEVYKDACWHSTRRLPFPISSFSMNVIGNHCYILGGRSTVKNSTITVRTLLSTLLDDADITESQYETIQNKKFWEKANFPLHPLPLSSIVEVDGKIVSMGGADPRSIYSHGTKLVGMYDEVISKKWVECEGVQLPMALDGVGAVKIGKNKVMIVGGETRRQRYTNGVYIGEFESVK